MNWHKRLLNRLCVLWRNLFYTFEENTGSIYLLGLNSLLEEIKINDERHDDFRKYFDDRLIILENDLYASLTLDTRCKVEQIYNKLVEAVTDNYNNLGSMQSIQLDKQNELEAMLNKLSADLAEIQKDTATTIDVNKVSDEVQSLMNYVSSFRKEGINNLVENFKESMEELSALYQQEIRTMDSNLAHFDRKREFHIRINDFARFVVDAAIDKVWEKGKVSLVDNYNTSLGSMSPNIMSTKIKMGD